MVGKFSTSKKGGSEKGGAPSEAKYSKINKANAADNLDDYGDEGASEDFGGSSTYKLKKGKRDHEIYKDTYYLPNDKARLLEIPMNSNLIFQMLLYYHTFYDILYAVLLIPTGIFKLSVGRPELTNILSFIMFIFFLLFEAARMNFGYKGNINESFPELIAFLLQTTLFSFWFVVGSYL